MFSLWLVICYLRFIELVNCGVLGIARFSVEVCMVEMRRGETLFRVHPNFRLFLYFNHNKESKKINCSIELEQMDFHKEERVHYLA